MAWPQKISRGQQRSFNLDLLYHNFEKELFDPEVHNMHVPGQTWILGYALPSFQRGRVWDDLQSIRFVESSILGLGLGTYTYNATDDLPTTMVEGKPVFHRTDRWLIDGQQRLTALFRYFNDEFPVFGLLWSQVEPVAQRKYLMSTPFDAFEVSISDEAVLRELYDRMAFGGVPHRPEERAVHEDDPEVVPSGIGRP